MEFKDFEVALRADEEKAAKFKQALESAKDNGAKSDVEALAMAAAAVGCELTPEQVEQSLASSSEVSDEDLDLVAGGKEDGWCVFSYNCYTALLHEKEQNKDAACWSDYNCFSVEHSTPRLA